ncbi:MAG: efflux RND transporter permease subunit [Gammaproteobacteria bacterium]
MLAGIIRFSIHHRGVVIGLASLLMLYGIYQISRAGLDIFPEFSPKLVIIQTEAPGYSAEQVELLVTRPIENALNGTIDVEYIRSESIQGLSIVNVFFEESTDIYRNRQLVSERLVDLDLPPGVGPAKPVPLASSSATILTIGVTSDSRSLMELRDIVDWTITPRLLSVEGVADVNTFGGDVRQLQIQLLPEKLEHYGLGVNDVAAAAEQATGITGSGFIENSNQRLTLVTKGQPAMPEELTDVVVARRDGHNITLNDVARIDFGAAPPFGAATIMTEPGIVMMVIGQYGANTLTVSRAVEAVLEDLKPILEKQGVRLYTDLFRPANYIEASLYNISSHLLVGGLFVITILYLFLFNFKTAFISALAIPLSLLSAVIVLLESGINLNIMVLGGLAIALGEVVDDAIIDTENIFRRLRENRSSGNPRAISDVVFHASMEVRSSVVYASFIVALVFVPLLSLSGVAGRLFAPLGYTYILAILMSLLVALTVTPALCYLLLGRTGTDYREPPLIRRIQPVFSAMLMRLSRFPTLVITGTLLFCLLGIAILPMLGTKFLPELREGHYIVHTTSIPGTSLEESIRIGNRLTEQFLEIPGVRSVSQWAGRAERGADTYGSHYSEYEVDLEPLSGKEQQQVLDELRRILDEFPGILYEANTFLIERVDETISGYSSPVVVNIYGEDLELLDEKVRQIAGVMQDIDGATDIQVRSPPGTPELEIRLRRQALNHWGLGAMEVMEALRVAYEGKVVGRVHRGERVIDVTVILPSEKRAYPEDLENLPISTPDGDIVRLSRLADLKQSSGRYNILHQGSRRLQTVTCNVTGRDIGSFMDELREKVLERVEFDADSVPEFTGAAVEQRKAREELLLHSALAGILVLMLIYMAIGSLRHMLLTLANLPFSLVGGVIAVLLTSQTLSVGSMVGFITLFGITVRNSIMLISHYRYLVETDGCPWNLQTMIRGAQERLPSILMTALVTALAMAPIAFDSDNPGREIMGPMAAIIIGGLISSTILNLLIMPIIMHRFGRFDNGSRQE